MIVQILIILITFISYVLVRKLKDNGSTAINKKKTENPWQQKLYKKQIYKKKVVDFIYTKRWNKRV